MPPNDTNASDPLSALEQDELRHRLRNHLQSMTSLINLQIRRARHPEAVRALEDLRARFGAIASIYVDVDDASERPIEIGALLTKFVRGTVELYDPMGRQTVSIDIVPVSVSGQRAVVLGQIMVELLINAYRHGTADRAGGRISITLTTQDGEAMLAVADDGPGLIEPAHGPSAFRTIASLARALGGTFTHENRDGFVARVQFPLRDPVRAAN